LRQGGPQEKIMHIRLLREYKNYRVGSVIEVPNEEGLELIVTHRAIRARKGDYMRNINSPPMDKMITKADRDK